MNKYAVDNDATTLRRRPLQLLVAELGVDLVRRSDGLCTDFVGVGRDENVECHSTVVRRACLSIDIPENTLFY